jgi:hypothetical protein
MQGSAGTHVFDHVGTFRAKRGRAGGTAHPDMVAPARRRRLSKRTTENYSAKCAKTH